MNHRPLHFALVLSILAFAACAESARTTVERVDPETAFRTQLGRRWELARLGDQPIPRPRPGTPLDSPGRDLVPGRRPTLRFVLEPRSAGGRSFCNGYGGPFEFHGDSLTITDIMSSAVGCDSTDSLETRFFRGLRNTRRFQIDSASLVLIGIDGSRMVFEPSDSASTWP
jgi:heat shock protein HslJ